MDTTTVIRLVAAFCCHRLSVFCPTPAAKRLSSRSGRPRVGRRGQTGKGATSAKERMLERRRSAGDAVFGCDNYETTCVCSIGLANRSWASCRSADTWQLD